ncbi:MAG: hypothetical protein Q7U53_19410 [Anaerolineaceae bacterium]|nr:hypothetical protein [Anaerolineaceae bacterium]
MNAAMTLILACLGIFGFFIILFGFLLLMRYLNYRENLKLAEKGIFPHKKQVSKPKKGFLTAGVILTIVGFLSTLIFWFLGIRVFYLGGNFPLGLGPWVLLGLIPFFVGLVFLLIFVINSPSNGRGKDEKQDYVQMYEIKNQKFEVGFENDESVVTDK